MEILEWLKWLFRAFIILPAVALSSCTVVDAAIGGDSGKLSALVASVIASIAYLKWEVNRARKNFVKHFVKHASSLGVNPEHVAFNFEDGIVIDKTNKKLFVGTIVLGKIKWGKVLDFEEISSIGWEGDRYIFIRTKNFDLPRLVVDLGYRAKRDEAYEKLRAALGID